MTARTSPRTHPLKMSARTLLPAEVMPLALQGCGGSGAGLSCACISNDPKHFA